MRNTDRAKNVKKSAFQSGMSLPGAMLALVLVSIASSGVITLIHQLTNSQRALELVRNRDKLGERLETAISLPAALAHSFAVSSNLMLQTCVLGTTPNACDSNEIVFELKNKLGNGVLATAAPVSRYSGEGVQCTVASPKCPFEVVAFMKPICPSGAATCTTATGFETRAIVRQASSVTVNIQMARMRQKEWKGDVTTAAILALLGGVPAAAPLLNPPGLFGYLTPCGPNWRTAQVTATTLNCSRGDGSTYYSSTFVKPACTGTWDQVCTPSAVYSNTYPTSMSCGSPTGQAYSVDNFNGC